MSAENPRPRATTGTSATLYVSDNMIEMRKLFVAAALGLAGLGVLVSSCGGGGTESTTAPLASADLITSTASTTPRARRTATPSPTATATPLEVCAPNPDPAPPNLLQILEPLPGAEVKIPVHVRGWSSTIGEKGTVSLGVVDEKQNPVQVINLPAEPRDYRVAPPGMDVTDATYPFAADVVLNDVTQPTPYCLWVYLGTDDQGHARQVVQVPVVFLPRG